MELSTTTDYHKHNLDSLGWELTVCNALQPENTPIRKVLTENASYGHLLYQFLKKFIPVDNLKSVLEIGGGYGYLMRALFDLNPSIKAMMIDVSPNLLQKQREHLVGCDVGFREEDFLVTDVSVLQGFDLAIMNENLGDFPTLTNVHLQALEFSGCKVAPVLEMKHFFEEYSLPFPSAELFNLNLGAMKAVEKLCRSGIPSIFLAEHSCEANVSGDSGTPIHVRSAGTPERISLKGHDEYSIQFSYLKSIGESFGYRCIRGPFADFIPVEMTDYVRRVLAGGGRGSDDAEIVCQFVEDLYKYEYLLLVQSDQ